MVTYVIRYATSVDCKVGMVTYVIRYATSVDCKVVMVTYVIRSRMTDASLSVQHADMI